MNPSSQINVKHRMSNKVVIFGFSANPPANHHLAIVKKLLGSFDKVIIIPRGTDKDKPTTAETTPLQRKEMVKLAFKDLSGLEADFIDLDHDIFTPTWMIDKKYKAIFSDSEIWHAIGGDIVRGGTSDNSAIQTQWHKGKEIWSQLNWAVIDHPDFPVNPKDLPPHSCIVKMRRFTGRSTTIRNTIRANQPISDLVPPEVERYILENNLYK